MPAVDIERIQRKFTGGTPGGFAVFPGAPRRIFRRNSLLDNHAPMRYTICVNSRSAKSRLT